MGEVMNATIQEVIGEVKKEITGKDDCIGKVFAAILAGGHILIEDVPGVGKTTMAMAFSRVLGLDSNRMQFTPDVMPADIIGFHMYQKETGKFEYYPGTIMCNLFFADEINRTSPKTQSALLEVMEEGRVTVDGEVKEIPQPFIVMATQNPKGSAGTQLLPESQLDRFMICISMGYPTREDEVAILKGKSKTVKELSKTVLDTDTLKHMQSLAENIYMDDSILNYIATLAKATREHSYIELGLSTRGAIACTRMAKAWAYLKGRDYVLPEDVTDIFMDVTRHRIVLSTKARVAHITATSVLEEILIKTNRPASYKKKED